MGASADSLSAPSRAFYERAYFKTFLSIVYAGLALMYLGFCAEAGGLSASNQETLDSNVYTHASSDTKNNFQALISGYGFACFSFFVAFLLALVAACHISPLISGSKIEAATVRSPAEV